MRRADMLWHLTVCPRRSSRAASANSPPLMMCGPDVQPAVEATNREHLLPLFRHLPVSSSREMEVKR